MFKGQQAGMRFNPNVMRLNVAQSQVDTITSKIGRNKPRPLYLTRQGDYMLRRKAKRLGDSMEGLFMEQNPTTSCREFSLTHVFRISASSRFSVKATRSNPSVFSQTIFFGTLTRLCMLHHGPCFNGWRCTSPLDPHVSGKVSAN